MTPGMAPPTRRSNGDPRLRCFSGRQLRRMSGWVFQTIGAGHAEQRSDHRHQALLGSASPTRGPCSPDRLTVSCTSGRRRVSRDRALPHRDHGPFGWGSSTGRAGPLSHSSGGQLPSLRSWASSAVSLARRSATRTGLHLWTTRRNHHHHQPGPQPHFHPQRERRDHHHHRRQLDVRRFIVPGGRAVGPLRPASVERVVDRVDHASGELVTFGLRRCAEDEAAPVR